ncbi:hypothetical protein ABPG72_002965 [Tetrahymena utriculariae]
MIGLLFFLLKITSIIFVKSQCYLGCNNCILNSNTFSYACQGCNSNFQYDQTLANCVYSDCKQQILLQIDNNQQNQCVSICEDSSVSLKALNQCIQTRICSQNFNTQTTFSNNQKVLDIFQYQQQYYLIKYNGFLNIIHSENGQYTLSVYLDTTTVLCEFIFGKLILVKSDNSLYQFILENQQQIQLSQITQGTVNSSSFFKDISQDLLILTSTEQNSQNLFLHIFRYQNNSISFVNYIQIQIQSQKLYFFDAKIIFFSQNSIKLYELQDNQDKVTLKSLSQNIVCQWAANSLILNVLTSPDQLYYYVFIQNSQSIFKYSQNQHNCSQVSLMGNLINSIVDIQYYLQNQYIYLVALTFDNKLSLFQSGLAKNSAFTLLSQINLKIINPSIIKLFVSQNIYKDLFVAGNDFELIKINELNQMQKLSVTQAFTQQMLSNQSSINQIYFDSVTQLLYSCSSEGQIIIWNSISSYDLKYYKSFYFYQDSCIDFIVYQNYYLAVLLTKSISVFDLQKQQQQVFSNQNQQIAAYTLQSSQKYLLIALGSCVNILADQIKIVLSYCSNQYQTAIKHFLINDNQLITVSSNQVILSNIDFDLKEIVIAKIQNTQFQLINYIKNESKINSLIIFDQKQTQFIVFDYSLNVLDQHTLAQVSQLIDVNIMVDYDCQYKYRYFITYICNLPQLTYKYCLSTMLQGESQVILLRNLIQVNMIITSFKYTNLNNQHIYKVIVNSSVSTTQIQVQIKWSYNTNLANLDNLFYLRNEVSTQYYFNQQNQQIYQGHQSGYLGLNIAYAKQGFFFYQNPQGSSDIQVIQQIYDIGKIFIIKKTILVYDVTQQLFIEEIKLDDEGDKSIEYIQQFQYNKNLKIATCFKSYNFFILKYNQNTQTPINLKNFSFISNYYLQENQQIIYIYGANISKYEIQSQQLQVIYTPDTYIISSCTFSIQIIICQTNPQQITILNNTDYSIIQIITSKDFQDQSILKIDQLQNNILIYKNNIFSYSIANKMLIQVLKQNQLISQLKIYGSKIVVFTKNNVFIYSRDNILLLASFQLQGNFVNSIYLDAYNNIIYHTDDVSKGQLYSISLDTLTQIPSISDYYSQTIPRSVFYDRDNSFLSFTDNQGYLQVYQYSRKTLDTPVNIEEFNGNSILNVSIDYNTGNLIIYNQQYAYILNYNNLIGTYIRAYQVIPYKYIIFKNIFIVASSDNVLYNYSNQSFSYLTEFDDLLQGIYQTQNNNAIILFFNNYFLLYQDVVGVIRNSNFSQKVDNISIRQFLDDDIFMSANQQIIHYSYQQNKILFQFQFQQVEILKQYYTNQKLQIILLGFSTGKVQAYNKISQQLYTVAQQISQSVISFQSYQNQIWITFQQGKLIIFTYEQILLSNQIPINDIDLLVQTNALQNLKTAYLELKQIYIDEIYNRFYIHFNQFKQIYTISIQDFSVECKMLFPHNRLNSLLASETYIILQTSSQLNFHLRSTQQFIFFIKDDFRRQQQYQTIVVNDSIVIITFLQKINIYQINKNIPYYDTNNNDFFKMIDSQILSYPQIMQYNFNTNTQTLQIIGFTSNSIFDYLYDVFLNPSLLLNQCVSVIKVQNAFQFQNQLMQQQQSSSRLSQTYYIYIKDSLNILNLVNQQTNQIIVKPQDKEVIQLDIQSLSYFQFQAFIKQFNFYFRDLGEYSFSKSVQQINIENSSILQQNIQDAEYNQNQNILFLSAFNYFEDQSTKINLTNDILNLNNIQLMKNLFRQIDQSQINQINIQNIAMIQIQNTYANINNLTSMFNNMNIVFNQSQQIVVLNSSFQNNTALEGGALYFQNIIDYIQIKNTIFKNNFAYASGGAILFDRVKSIFIDQTTNIKSNVALIGGGIRIKGIEEFQFFNQGTIYKNKAEIYGDNIATYPSQIQIQSFSQQKEQFSFKSDINLGKIWIDNFKSGGSLDFDIYFMDGYGKYLNFSANSLKQGIYPKIIQNEISQWNAHLIVLNSSLVQLVGESSVNYNSYNETTKSFPFKTLYINSIPQTSQILILKYQLVDYIQPNLISIEINFRNCKAGEIDHNLNGQIRSCLSCNVGHYSMYNYSQNYNQSEVVCKQCPQESQICEFDHFLLKQGFWRSSNLSDQIFQCTKYKESCNELNSDNKLGCIQGYVGPLCEQCDYSGMIWLNRYSENSSKSYCQKCSPTANQITILMISTFMIIIYLFLQVQFIVQNLNLYLQCNYVRLMNLLPISVSQYKNINTFYIKCLMNFLQIQLILIRQIDQIPQFISFLPNTIGQPSSITAIGSLCLVPPEIIDKNGQGRTKLMISQFYNLIIVLTMVVLILIKEYSKIDLMKLKKSYFRYNALYFLYTFMQPDSVSLIAKFLTCRNIGDQRYFTEDLQIKCDQFEYLQFQYYIGIPLLIFWISLPAFFLFKLLRMSSNLRNPSVIFCYGYFFIEYKQNKYYWEFVRIYTKVVVILFFTLYNDNSSNMCIYQQCDQNLYYQKNEDPTISSCLDICNDYYQASNIQNTCNLLNQCPQSFITQTIYNNNSNIQNIISYQDSSYLIFLFKNFLNYVNQTTGEIILRFNYDNNNLGVFMDDYYLVTYDFLKNTNYTSLLNLQQQQIQVIDFYSNIEVGYISKNFRQSYLSNKGQVNGMITVWNIITKYQVEYLKEYYFIYESCRDFAQLQNKVAVIQNYSVQNAQNIVNFLLDECIPNQIQIINNDQILQQLNVLDDNLNIQFQTQLNEISQLISIKPFIDLNQQTWFFLVYKNSLATYDNLYYIAAINEKKDQFTFLMQTYDSQFIKTGSKSGLAGISSSTSKYANKIYQNLLKDINIKEFDLILNTYIEDISFDDTNQIQIEYVQGFKIYNNLILISCYKSYQIVIKSYNYIIPQIFKLTNFGTITVLTSTLIPNTFVQPSSFTVVDTLCIISSETLDRNGHGKNKLIILQINNLILGTNTICLILIPEKFKFNQINFKKYLRYNAFYFLYTFMQPDSLRLITKFLTYRTIGDKKYLTEDLLIACNQSDYQQFQHQKGIPLLIFWIVFPAIIFLQICKKSKNLNISSTIFRYGYFFIENKKNKCCWEFVRIYLKVLIVIFFTLNNGNQQFSYMVIVMLIVIFLSYLNNSDAFLNQKMIKKRVEVSMTTFQKWKKTRRSLKFLIDLQAVNKMNQKISQQESQICINLVIPKMKLESNLSGQTPILNQQELSKFEGIWSYPNTNILSPISSQMSLTKLLLNNNIDSQNKKQSLFFLHVKQEEESNKQIKSENQDDQFSIFQQKFRQNQDQALQFQDKFRLSIFSFFSYFIYLIFVKPYIRNRWYVNQYGKKCKPIYYPVLGNIKFVRESFKKYGDSLQWIRELLKNDDDVQFLIGYNNIHIVDAQLAKDITLNNLQNIKKDMGMQFGDLLFKQGIIFSEGEKWKKQRQILSHSFSFDVLKNRVSKINSIVKEMVNKIQIEEGKPTKIVTECTKITAEVVLRSFFGERFSSQQHKGTNLGIYLAQLLLSVFNQTRRLRMLIPLFFFPKFMSKIFADEKYYEVEKNCLEFRQLIEKEVSLRIDNYDSNETQKDFLDILVDEYKLNYSKNDGKVEDYITKESIIHQFIVFFFAGMDTTGNLTGIMLYWVSKRKDIYEKLVQEIKSVFGQDKDPEINDEQLKKLNYCHMFIQECLRYHCPAMLLFTRKAERDFYIGDNILVQKGMQVNISLHGVLRREKYFQNPDEFIPERFSEENKKNINHLAFIPFSSGPKNCIGQHMALIEAKIILVQFILNFDITNNENVPLKMDSNSLYCPVNDEFLFLQRKL